MIPTIKKIDITHPGVNNGLHAGSSCCVNLVYFGLLDSFFTGDPVTTPVSDVLAPFIFPLSNPPPPPPHAAKTFFLSCKRNKSPLMCLPHTYSPPTPLSVNVEGRSWALKKGVSFPNYLPGYQTTQNGREKKKAKDNGGSRRTKTQSSRWEEEYLLEIPKAPQ
jgi:hypothetical protein